MRHFSESSNIVLRWWRGRPTVTDILSLQKSVELVATKWPKRRNVVWNYGAFCWRNEHLKIEENHAYEHDENRRMQSQIQDRVIDSFLGA